MIEINIGFLFTNDKIFSSKTVQMFDTAHVIFFKKSEQIYIHLLIKLGEEFSLFYSFH